MEETPPKSVREQHESILDRLTREANERFTAEDVFEVNPELARLWEEVEAFNTSETDEPIRTSSIEYEGFTSESGLENLPDDLQKVFTKDLLEACVISRVVNRDDIVNVLLGEKDMYMTVEEFRDWSSVSPEIKKYKVRAENNTAWVTQGYVKALMPLPIHLYSFEGENMSDYDYLDSDDEVEKLYRYKFGAVAHEVAHHIQNYLLTERENEALEKLCTQYPPLTPYTKKYLEGTHQYRSYVNEQFCEAIRLLTTNPHFLKLKAPDLYNYIRGILPEITSLDGDIVE